MIGWWANAAGAWDSAPAPCENPGLVAGEETWLHCGRPEPGLYRLEGRSWQPLPLPTACSPCGMLAARSGPLWAFREGPGASARLLDGAWEPWRLTPHANAQHPDLFQDGQRAMFYSTGNLAMIFEGDGWSAPFAPDSRYFSGGCSGSDVAWGMVDSTLAGAALVRVWPRGEPIHLPQPPGFTGNCALVAGDHLLATTRGGLVTWTGAGWEPVPGPAGAAYVRVFAGGHALVGEHEVWRLRGAEKEVIGLPCAEGAVAVDATGSLRVRCGGEILLEGRGVPASHRALALSALPAGPHRGWAADVDGDGLDDAVIQPGDGAAPLVALQRAGDLVPGGPRWSLPVEAQLFEAAGMDLDGDGDAEVVTSLAAGDLAMIRSWRTWGEWLPLETRRRANRHTAVPQAVDVDDDGDLDLVIAAGERRDLYAPGWSWRESRWPPTWPERHPPAAYASGWARQLVPADLDGDGREDAIEVSGWRPTFRVLSDWKGQSVDRTEGSGLGGWWGDPRVVELVEVAGAPTLLVASAVRGPRAWRSVGGFRFDEVTDELGLTRWHDRIAETAVMRDYDGDGLVDLASCHREWGCLTLRGTATGFEEAPWRAPADGVSVWTIDLGGDGRSELVFARAEDEPVALSVGEVERTGRRAPPSPEPASSRLWWGAGAELELLAWMLSPALSFAGLRRDHVAGLRLLPVLVGGIGVLGWWLAPAWGPGFAPATFLLVAVAWLALAAVLLTRARRARLVLGRYRLARSPAWPALAVGADPLDTARALGAGSAGLVLAGQDLFLRRRVALKALYPGSREASRALAEVGRRLERVSSPHLVPLVDVHVTRDRAWVVMGLVLGSPLSEVIGSGPVAPELALRLVHDVLLALTALHDADVVHGDLSARNVVLTPQGTAVVIDLGLAMRPGERVLGFTPGFAAPELVGGGEGSPAADVFSVGALWWALRTGRAPALVQDLLLPDTPPALRAAVSADPAARPRSGAALRANLPEPRCTRAEVVGLLDRPSVAPARLTETRTWPLA